MLRKLIVVSILFLSITIVSNPARAASCTVYQYNEDTGGGYYYSIAGSLKLSVTFNNYLSATITLPNLQNLGTVVSENFYFDNYGYVYDDLLYNYAGGSDLGTYSQSGCNVTIDFTDAADAMVSLLSSLGIAAEVSSSTTATAKISSKDGSNSGKVSININITSPLQGSASVQLTFKGTPYAISSASLPQRGKSSIKPELEKFLKGVFSLLPRKDAAPQK
jgi:hypothetical protein